MPRRCRNCRHFRGEYQRCECPDWETSTRALRTSDDGQWCGEHEEATDVPVHEK